MGLNYEIVKDPIHGYIKIYEHEKQIIDTPIFQRLRRIMQNTAVHYSYPCATHTRFSHSLGVMHIAGFFTENLLDRVDGIKETTKKKYYFLMRLWGLLHDIGHGPFSHTFVDVIFKPLFNTDHEKFGARILQQCSFLPQILTPDKNIEICLNDVAKLFEVKSIEEFPLNDTIDRSTINERILYYICRGAYSADIMDFLLRDSYFTGAGYGNIDWKRLIFTSTPFNDKVLLDQRGEEAFDSLLFARLFMFSAVYYHRTTRAAVKVICSFLKEAKEKIDFSSYIKNVDDFTKLDEDSIMFTTDLITQSNREQLLYRKIPYTQYFEKNEEVGLLSSRNLDKSLTEDIRAKLPKKLQNISEDAFFVDTPVIKLNPYFGNEEDVIFLTDSTKKEGYHSRKIWDTNWGKLQRRVLLLRLFIHDDFREHENEIIDAFELQTEDTHY